jgi:uncharacterized delta-60 repeat protein
LLGADQRPVLVCSSPAQAALPSSSSVVGPRLKLPAVDTPRVVSFPRDGRPDGTIAVRVFGPAPDAPFTLARAATRDNRIAVLGTVKRGSRQVLTLMTLQAGPPTGTPPVAQWSVTRKIELGPRPRVTADQCAVGWLLDQPVVVAPGAVRSSPDRPGIGRQPAVPGPKLTIYEEGETATVVVPLSRNSLDLPRSARPELRVGAVCGIGDGLLVGLSWIVRKGRLVQGRASVLRLVRDGATWSPDPAFGTGGLWLASSAEGGVTTADLVALSPDGLLVVIGRGVEGRAAGVFGAWLDLGGQVAATGHFAQKVLPEPAGMSIDANGRVFVCGSTRRLDNNPPNDPAEAVVLCLLPGGQPDPGFGAAGVARFRLNGGTYATSVHATSTGAVLVASAMRWGSGSRSGKFHPCVTRLSADGSVDPNFGLAGVCRHDGLGEVNLVALAPSGRLWSAGIAKTWEAATSSWQSALTVSQLTLDGGLETGFGTKGSVNHRLQDPPLSFKEYDARSLVPTADGGAFLAGAYIIPRGNDTEGGTWIARLTSAGQRDAAFGSGGISKFPARALELAAELADGSLQGLERLEAQIAPLRLTAAGAPAPGFGPTGAKPIPKAPVTFPSTYEPTGEWFAPVWGRLSATGTWSIGLIRCLPDGTIDPNFGAGGPSPTDDKFVPTAEILALVPRQNPRWEYEEDERLGRHQTLRLADGTCLTLWNVVFEFQPLRGRIKKDQRALALIAWTAQGAPRPAWGKAAKAIPRIVGWRFRTALLQTDGSVLVGIDGDDGDDAAAADRENSGRSIRGSAYFCRLLPGSFDLDPAFGGGSVTRRLPGEDERVSQTDTLVDYQVPEALRPLNANAVIAAVRCETGSGPLFPGFFNQSPHLLADGSVGLVRLV